MKRPCRFLALALCSLIVILFTGSPGVARADPTIPPVWDIVADDFESGSLDAWEQVSEGDLRAVPGAGRTGSSPTRAR